MSYAPHSSHTMIETLEGELYCSVCHAAPWMPLVESECGKTPTQPVTERHKARIIGLYEDLTPISDIAEVTGVSQATVREILVTSGVFKPTRARKKGKK